MQVYGAEKVWKQLGREGMEKHHADGEDVDGGGPDLGRIQQELGRQVACAPQHVGRHGEVLDQVPGDAVVHEPDRGARHLHQG